MSSKLANTEIVENVKKKTKPYRLFFQKFQHDWSFVLSSMLAFHILMALLPMAIIFFGILILILGNNLDLQNQIKTNLINIFPPKANESLRDIINLAFEKLYHDAKIILIFGIFFSIIGCLRLFIAIDRCLTIIYYLEERKFFSKYFLSCKILFLFLIFLPLIIIISSIPSIYLNQISNTGNRFGIYILGFLISLLLTFILFQMIYLLIPNKKMKFKQTWCGAIFAASFLQLFMILFPLYIRKSLMSYTGQIGFIIILIFFLFYFAIILILGAQINAFFFEHIQPLPLPLGTFINKCIQDYQELSLNS